MGARGRSANIVAADTDTPIVTMPRNKEMKVTRMMMSNNNGGQARVRIYDTFTEVDTTVHSTTVNPVVLFDRQLAPNESVDILADEQSDGLCTAVGNIVGRSTVGAADPNDVTVGVWGVLE